ncbi:hypothetical protein FDB50_15395 [Clostridium botulinum]|uniref:Uncharacterized protein n=1 Tax=Clostridium botulinum TaxID=1491 RepID=A0A846JTS6_CLOBO|nr:hypothetical protein [Clostridium botulinum]NFN36424.1 hypothetical protein [Clostridium botulinum]
MELNKKSFMELIRRSSKNNIFKKINIVIWHGDSIEYSNAIYNELMFTCNEENYPQHLDECEDLDLNLYYGDTLEDNEKNLKEIYKIAKQFKRKIKTWIKGTWLEDIEIVIQEENI